MSLLALENVTKLDSRGRVVLRDVTLRVEAAELVALWGVARSGRTTLLHVAAGMMRPDEGAVRFDGRDLSAAREMPFSDELRFVQPRTFATQGRSVSSYVATPLLARGVRSDLAWHQAGQALEGVAAAACGDLEVGELDAAEFARVAIAEALVTSPRLLLVDEPTRGVHLLERAAILMLLRRAASGGAAVLMTTGEALGVSGADRAFAIGDGELRSEVVPALAPVVSLPEAASRARSVG
jgi:putative ABC transport system ATP-binding protein